MHINFAATATAAIHSSAIMAATVHGLAQRLASRLLTAAAGLALALCCVMAWAQEVGSVIQLSGTLTAQRADGTRILEQKSRVMRGDTLVTQKDSFAQINFTDGSSATLRPNSVMRIDEYQFDKNKPQADSLSMRLLKGGLRTVTGLVGRRGNQDAYKIQTSTTTVGIRGSSGDTLDCTQGCEGVTGRGGRLAPGVYHITHTGLYILITKGGTLLVAPGQVGFVDDPNKPPVLLGGDVDLGLDPFPFSLGSFDPTQECAVR